MATKYQFQLLNANAREAPLGPPVQMDNPYPFNVGDSYVFGPNNAAPITRIGHYITRDIAGNHTFTTLVVVAPGGVRYADVLTNEATAIPAP